MEKADLPDMTIEQWNIFAEYAGGESIPGHAVEKTDKLYLDLIGARKVVLAVNASALKRIEELESELKLRVDYAAECRELTYKLRCSEQDKTRLTSELTAARRELAEAKQEIGHINLDNLMLNGTIDAMKTAELLKNEPLPSSPQTRESTKTMSATNETMQIHHDRVE